MMALALQGIHKTEDTARKQNYMVDTIDNGQMIRTAAVIGEQSNLYNYEMGFGVCADMTYFHFRKVSREHGYLQGIEESPSCHRRRSRALRIYSASTAGPLTTAVPSSRFRWHYRFHVRCRSCVGSTCYVENFLAQCR